MPIKVLLTEEQIRIRIQEMGKQIREDLGPDSKPLFVGVLQGAAVFLADLIRCIDGELDYDFVSISSYGNAPRSSGVVRIMKDLDQNVVGRDVVVVEDIVDTGLTLKFLLDNLRLHNAKSYRIATLLDKPARRQIDVNVDYVGFDIPDEFVIGYGLDYAGKYRNLPYIGVFEGDPE